jgi:hypothetical protein
MASLMGVGNALSIVLDAKKKKRLVFGISLL